MSAKAPVPSHLVYPYFACRIPAQSVREGRQEGGGVSPINSYKHVTDWPGIQSWDLTSSPSFGAAHGNICRRLTVFPEEPFFVPRAPDSLGTRPFIPSLSGLRAGRSGEGEKFTCLVNKYLLRTYYVPGIVADAKGM